MTSAVTSSFSRKLQCSADEDSADEKRCARYGMSCDDISLDVITISSCLSADEAKRKRRCDVIQQEDFALIFQQTKLQCIQSQRKDIQSQEDFQTLYLMIQSLATALPVESLFVSAVATLPVVVKSSR
ncbi:hypothetical protein F511_40808 [Dorcoceras hygrometricum]|uniref:Uncharacterized protein n=1 Tax=Dorcoceras hygrometricum TaxID=472368 RepID=A0A2Z7BLV1_9LAMI|nr:hypothetical protein F511_40808 [Dorcoceras hygrometricum]